MTLFSVFWGVVAVILCVQGLNGQATCTSGGQAPCVGCVIYQTAPTTSPTGQPDQEDRTARYLLSGCADDNKLTKTNDHYVLQHNSSQANACIIRDIDLTQPEGDYTIEADLYTFPLPGGGRSVVGLAYSMQDNHNAAYIIINAASDDRPCITFGKVDNRTTTDVTEAACPSYIRPTTGSWFNLKVKVKESDVKAYVDGVLIARSTRFTYQGSRPGLFGVSGATVFFKNFRVAPTA